VPAKQASVQSVRLGIQAIQQDVVELAGGDYRAVLEVSGVARPFDDDVRLEGLLAGFATFLNSLNHPIQIVVRATPVDLSRYLSALEERGRRVHDSADGGGQLADLARDHAGFVQGLARQRTLLERRFYVVVPAESAPPMNWTRRLRGARGDSLDLEPRREAARRQLNLRCEDLRRQFARCGLAARRLGDLELAQLYLACWSPERARAQRFRQQLDDYTTLAVRATHPVAGLD
jgi:hypothetical protein